MAMRKKQIDVNALFIPVTPAFFLLLKKKKIETRKVVINTIDSTIGFNEFTFFHTFLLTLIPIFYHKNGGCLPPVQEKRNFVMLHKVEVFRRNI
jgi:hypothetical protein